jgi:hypothetical protein
VTVPPSPTWQIAPETTERPRPPETTTRPSRTPYTYTPRTTTLRTSLPAASDPDEN